ncbi:hypothetical protein EHQ86_00320 [Leptospira yasudae]|nr:hypothetical protein EHQ86_00320 [Leptospira yasudae]
MIENSIKFKIAINTDKRLKNKYKDFCRKFGIIYPTNFEQVEFSISDLKSHIVSGLSFACGYYRNNHRHGKEFIGSNLLVLDVDGVLNIEEALEHPIVAANASLIYTTVNHTAERNKFRIIFLVSMDLNRDEYYNAIRNLHSQFKKGEIDTSCSDHARNFYGNTNAKFYLDSPRFISDELLTSLLKPVTTINFTNFNYNDDKRLRYAGEERRKEKIEYPEILLDRIKHALEFIPNKVLDDGRHDTYFKLTCALRSVMNMSAVLNLLSTKISSNSSFSILDSLKSGITLNIGVLFSIAKEHGWTLGDYFQKISDRAGNEYQLPIPEGITESIHCQYLNDYKGFDSIQSRTIVIHSSHGTGKTDWVMNQLKDSVFIYLTHREELARDISKRLDKSGISNKFYKELDGNDFKLVRESLVICVDSIYKLNLSNYDNPIVVIDEIDQFVNHLHGPTCKEFRIAILSSLLQLTTISKRNYYLSADIPNITVRFIQGVLGIKDYCYLFNSFVPNKGRKLNLHQTEESVLLHAISRLKEGHKISIASFSKKKALLYEQRFLKEFGEEFRSKIICIVLETKNINEQRALLRDKSLVENYSVIIFSPVLSSGVDFNYPYSQYNYLLANANRTLDHFEGIQMAMRFRNYSELHLFIIGRKDIDDANSFVTSSLIRREGVLSEFLKFRKKHHMAMRLREAKISISEKLKKDCSSFILNSFLLKSRKRLLYFNLYSNLLNGFIYRGYTVGFYKGTSSPVGQLFNNSEIQDESYKILNAESINAATYYRILNEGATTHDEIFSKLNYEIKALIGYLPGDIESEADFRETVKSKINVDLLKEKMKNFKLLYFGRAYARNKDDRSIRRDMIQDYEFNELKYHLINNIYKLLPKEGWFKKDDLGELKQFVLNHYSDITENLFRVRKSHINEPMRFVSSFLNILGLKTEKKQKSKKKYQVYRIDKNILFTLEKRCRRLSIQFNTLNNPEYAPQVEEVRVGDITLRVGVAV